VNGGEVGDEGEESLEDLDLYVYTLRHAVFRCLDDNRDRGERDGAQGDEALEGGEGNVQPMKTGGWIAIDAQLLRPRYLVLARAMEAAHLRARPALALLLVGLLGLREEGDASTEDSLSKHHYIYHPHHQSQSYSTFMICGLTVVTYPSHCFVDQLGLLYYSCT
jgi:hypothetical protein